MNDLNTAADRPATLPARGPAAATIRDQAACALVLGVAAFAWFGWGQQGPPAGWAVFLGIGSGLGALVAVAALLLTLRNKTGASVMRDPTTAKRYGRTVGIEVGAILIGAAALILASNPSYVAAWVLFVVGVHFVPLARLFRIPSLAVAGVLVALVGVIAAILGIAQVVLPSAVAGGGGGLLMLAFGAVTLYRAWRQHSDSHESATL